MIGAAAIIAIVFASALAASTGFIALDRGSSGKSSDSSVSSTPTTSSGSTIIGSSVGTSGTSRSDSTTSSSASSVTSSSVTGSSSSTSISSTATSSSTPSVSGDWLTYHGSNSRDGYISILPNVTSPSVSWNTSVDAPVYAEPLSFNGSVFVATENNTVYSISSRTGAVEWSQHLGSPASSLKAPYACQGNHPDIEPTIGITGTPVIDPVSGTIYVVAMMNRTGYSLSAINTTTGQVRWTQPVAPAGFNFSIEEQRGALTLANGMVYIPFGGFSWDCGLPFGWIAALSSNDNGTQYSYKVPSAGEADVWAPEGLSVDGAGFIYAVTADSISTAPPFDFGESVIKLTPRLSVVSYFGASNWAYLNSYDLDLDTTGATLLPGNLIFSIGKEGVGYLLNSSDLGGIGGQVFSSPVCSTGAWGSTTFAAGIVYVPCADGLHALSLEPGPQPKFTSLWNCTGFFAGPPIVAAGAVWTFDIYNGTLIALNPQTGSVITKSFGGIGFVEHFTTPSIGDGLLLFAANETIYALDPSP